MMKPKNLVIEFYKSDAIINASLIEKYLHPEIILDWHSSQGFIQMNYDDILKLSSDLGRAYVRSKVKISQILEEGNSVSLRYSHYVKTMENPREEMLLAHFFVIWEIKDNLIYRGFQMSQLS